MRAATRANWMFNGIKETWQTSFPRCSFSLDYEWKTKCIFSNTSRAKIQIGRFHLLQYANCLMNTQTTIRSCRVSLSFFKRSILKQLNEIQNNGSLGWESRKEVIVNVIKKGQLLLKLEQYWGRLKTILIMRRHGVKFSTVS